MPSKIKKCLALKLNDLWGLNIHNEDIVYRPCRGGGDCLPVPESDNLFDLEEPDLFVHSCLGVDAGT